ncbi:hypothetical protein M9458_027736, partial [Cirrhinus mrigala]
SGCSRLEDFLTRLVTEPEEPRWDFSEDRLAFHTKPADESDAGVTRTAAVILSCCFSLFLLSKAAPE